MYILKDGYVIEKNQLVKRDIYICDGKIVDYCANAKPIDCHNLLITPGICDLHVHLREPGQTEKETILTGTKSAAKGGVTALFAMPNVIPYPDSLTGLKVEEDLISRDAKVKVYPYACLTKGEKGKELSDIADLASHVLGFSDDGRGMTDFGLLEKGQREVKKYNKIICSHAEDYNYVATDNRSEYEAVRQELACVAKTKVKYHFCHMSTKESFQLIKAAQDQGLAVTCEVTPHHLFLNETMINNDSNFKMNPPLRSEEDRKATLAALLTGVATVIATDHAPHTPAEKARPYDKAPNGIIGLETLVPLVYTKLIKTGLASWQNFLDWLVNNPRQIMGLAPVDLNPGSIADIACFNIAEAHKYTEAEILSKGKNSPFIGCELYGFCKYTFVDGKLVYGGE